MMNSIRIQGIVSDMNFSHEVMAEKFLKFKLSSKRKSGTCDVADVVISNDLANAVSLKNGETVEIYGNVRSCETVDERENLQNIFVFCETITQVAQIEGECVNEFILDDGVIVKTGEVRQRQNNRRLCSLKIASNSRYRSNYIPCLAWGRFADMSSLYTTGTVVKGYGRLQSRTYKKANDHGIEYHEICEVSMLSIARKDGEE